MLDPRLSAIAPAAAESITFVAASPVLPEGTPSIVRAGVVIVIIPVLLLAAAGGAPRTPSFLSSALLGAVYGMGASIVAGAVRGAGEIIDTALGSPPFLSVARAGGPMQRLYTLAYTLVLFGSGGFSAMVATLATAHGFAEHRHTGISSIVVLAGDSMRACLLLAGPCLYAQAMATILTGLVARVTPGVSGMLFGAQLSSASVIFVLVVGAATLGDELLDVVRHSLELATHAIR